MSGKVGVSYGGQLIKNTGTSRNVQFSNNLTLNEMRQKRNFENPFAFKSSFSRNMQSSLAYGQGAEKSVQE